MRPNNDGKLFGKKWPCIQTTVERQKMFSTYTNVFAKIVRADITLHSTFCWTKFVLYYVRPIDTLIRLCVRPLMEKNGREFVYVTKRVVM